MGRVKQVLTHWLEGFRSKNIQYTIALAFTGITLVAMTLVGIVLYTGFFSSAETMMKENNTRLVEQIGLNLDMYLKNMMRVSETAYYRVIKKHDLAVDDIGEQIELLYDANKDLLVSIVILDPEGNVVTSAPAAKKKEAQTAKDQAWFREALDKIENFHFSLPHVQNLFDDPDCRYRWVVSLSRAVELTENGQVGQGVLLLDINFSGIEQIFNNAGYGDSGYAYLVGEDGEMIYHPRQQLVYSDLFEEDSLAYVGEEDGNYIGKVSGQDSVITVKTVGYTGWKIVRVAPVGIYSDDVLFIQLAGLIGVVCLAILIILVNQSVSSQIARPVEQLQKSVEKLENGDLDAEIAIGGSYEIQRLGRTVQSMAQEMKKLMADVVKEQESKHKSELDALQHQINPHFLYNTLSSIVWMIEKGRAEESVNMIGALSRLFRISLSKGRTIIRVGDELEHAKSYLTIQKVRYKNKFTVTFDTDPEVLELSTVKLIIQPLLENAIYHGMEFMDGDGEITVRSQIRDGQLYIAVQDNGDGMPPDLCAKLLDPNAKVTQGKSGSRGSGLGMRNVHERIRLAFGAEYGLSIRSKLGWGTVVEAHLPCIPYDEENGGT